MPLSFWKRKSVADKKLEITTNKVEGSATPSRIEKVSTGFEYENPKRVSQGLQPAPPSAQKSVPWPWSVHPLVLEPPEAFPRPGVTPTSASSPSPFPRYGHSLSPTATDEGELILFGGLVNDIPTNDIYIISVLDGTTKLVETVGEIPAPRFGHANVLIRTTLFIWGGDTRMVNEVNQGASLDNTLYALNLVERHWYRIPVQGGLPDGRYGHAMCVTGEVLYIFGGQKDELFLNDIWILDLSFTESLLHFPQKPLAGHFDFDGSTKDARWKRVEHLSNVPRPPSRTNHTWTPYEDKIYLFGGTDGQYHYNDVWVFHIEQHRWTEAACVGYIPAPREGHTAALLDGFMYVFGGRGVDGQDMGDLGAFRIAHNRWFRFRNMGPAPSARSGHAMAAVNSTAFVLGGLSHTTNPFDDLSVVHLLETGSIKFPPLNVSPLKVDSGNTE